MTSLDLLTVLPGTADARDRGCTCPHHANTRVWPGIVLVYCGHTFSPNCPVHRRAVLVEVQHLFGRPQ